MQPPLRWWSRLTFCTMRCHSSTSPARSKQRRARSKSASARRSTYSSSRRRRACPARTTAAGDVWMGLFEPPGCRLDGVVGADGTHSKPHAGPRHHVPASRAERASTSRAHMPPLSCSAPAGRARSRASPKSTRLRSSDETRASSRAQGNLLESGLSHGPARDTPRRPSAPGTACGARHPNAVARTQRRAGTTRPDARSSCESHRSALESARRAP